MSVSGSAGTVAGRAPLPSGLIFEIARRAGIEIPGGGAKRTILCPFHKDETASAFLSERNVFFCSVCTPGGAWTAKAFALALGVIWPIERSGKTTRPASATIASAERRSFTPNDASHVWALALARARDNAFAGIDRAVYDYVVSRHLGESWELGAFGVLADEMRLPESMRSWPRRHYRLVAPLYDLTGSMANVQARAIANVRPKTLFPRGSSASGTLFASASGLEVLRGTWRGPRCAILGEGLTDYLGLSIATFAPVLSAPGTGMAARAVGPWVQGFEVYLGLDWDSAGDHAVGVSADRIREQGARRVLRLNWPGHAKDACDVIQARGVEGLSDFLRAHVHADW